MPFHIGKLIVDQLKNIGMTKSEFARRIGASPQTIHYILKRNSIDTALLQKISKALDYDFFQHYMGLRRVETRQTGLFITTPNDLYRELKQIKTELETIQRQNQYIREILELTNPDIRLHSKANLKLKSNKPNPKIHPKNKKQTK